MKLTCSAYETFSYEIVEKNSNEGKDYKLKCNFCSSEHSSNDEDKKFQNFFKYHCTESAHKNKLQRSRFMKVYENL